VLTTTGLVIASIKRHRLRTFVTVLSVMLSVGTTAVSWSGVRRIYAMQAGSSSVPRVMINSPITQRLISYADIQRIAALPKVKSVGWSRGSAGSIENGPDYSIWCWSPEYIDSNAGLVSVDAAQRDAWKGDKQGVLATQALLDALGKHVGDAVVLHSYFGDIQGRVDGVLGGYMGTGLVAVPHWEEASQIEGRPGATTIAAMVDPADYSTVIAEIEKAFEGSPDPVIAVPEKQWMLATVFGAEMVVPKLMLWISILMLTVTAVITASTLATSLRERRADFGMLRSLGFRRSVIVRLVITETSMICLAGGVLAAALCLTVFQIHGISLSDFTLRDLKVEPVVALLGIGVSFVIALLAGVWPAISISRVDVVEALGKA
jgi:putative ABC transport system permease protein